MAQDADSGESRSLNLSFLLHLISLQSLYHTFTQAVVFLLSGVHLACCWSHFCEWDILWSVWCDGGVNQSSCELHRVHVGGEGEQPWAPHKPAEEVLHVLPLGTPGGKTLAGTRVPARPCPLIAVTLICIEHQLLFLHYASQIALDLLFVCCWLPGQCGAQPQVLPADLPAHDAVWTVPTGGQPLLSPHDRLAGQSRPLTPLGR